MNKRPRPKGVLKRILKSLFKSYPVLLPITLFFIAINAVVSAIPALFMQQVLEILKNTIEESKQTNVWDWPALSSQILPIVIKLICFYLASITAGITYNQLLAVITQGYLKKMREEMFNHMQTLPIKYFDTNNHGDIMSCYTNDIDTLRQMVSQSIPQFIISGIIITCVFFIMLYFSLWLTLIVIGGVILIMLITKVIGGRSSKYL